VLNALLPRPWLQATAPRCRPAYSARISLRARNNTRRGSVRRPNVIGFKESRRAFNCAEY
jgi:hypothetical protein